MGLLFTTDAHAGLADGSITVTHRAWKRPHVKVGGVYRIGGTAIALHVDAVDVVPASSVPPEARERLGDADPVWRIEFHRVDEPEPRAALPEDEIVRRLDRMDARRGETWTRATLELIRDHPGVVSTVLAAKLGRERLPFKADVRKLKALGLTESLEVGYRLTPLGERVATR